LSHVVQKKYVKGLQQQACAENNESKRRLPEHRDRLGVHIGMYRSSVFRIQLQPNVAPVGFRKFNKWIWPDLHFVNRQGPDLEKLLHLRNSGFL